MSNIGSQLIYALLLAIPIGCVSWTVTNEEIFRDLREFLVAIYRCPKKNLCLRKLCYLPTCHYCFSHYVTAAFIALTGFKFLLPDWRGYVVAEFTLVLIANVYLTIYNILRLHLRKLRAQAEREETIVKQLKEALDKSSPSSVTPNTVPAAVDSVYSITTAGLPSSQERLLQSAAS